MSTLAHCAFDWDEPDGCTTTRGWLGLLNHPDNPDGKDSYRNRCCGFYLDYGPGTPGCSRGPNGETVLASAYIFRYKPIIPTERIGLGHAWFFTVEEAKAFIEHNIRAYFGVGCYGDAVERLERDGITLD